MSVRFGLYLLRKNLFPKIQLLHALFIYSLFYAGIFSFDQMQEKVFSILFKGKKADRVYKEAEEFCNSVYDSVVRSQIYSELESLRSSGAEVILLSSSPDFIVKAFAKKLRIERYFASKYLVNSAGEFIAVEPMNGAAKVKLFSTFTKQQKSIAFSDSFSDLELLQKVDVPVAVHPDRKLRRYAQKHKWRILGEEKACV